MTISKTWLLTHPSVPGRADEIVNNTLILMRPVRPHAPAPHESGPIITTRQGQQGALCVPQGKPSNGSQRSTLLSSPKSLSLWHTHTHTHTHTPHRHTRQAHSSILSLVGKTEQFGSLSCLRKQKERKFQKQWIHSTLYLCTISSESTRGRDRCIVL